MGSKKCLNLSFEKRFFFIPASSVAREHFFFVLKMSNKPWAGCFRNDTFLSLFLSLLLRRSFHSLKYNIADVKVNEKLSSCRKLITVSVVRIRKRFLDTCAPSDCELTRWATVFDFKFRVPEALLRTIESGRVCSLPALYEFSKESELRSVLNHIAQAHSVWRRSLTHGHFRGDLTRNFLNTDQQWHETLVYRATVLWEVPWQSSKSKDKRALRVWQTTFTEVDALTGWRANKQNPSSSSRNRAENCDI